MDPRTAELPELNLDRYLPVLVFVNDNVPGLPSLFAKGLEQVLQYTTTLSTRLLLQLEPFAQVNDLLALSFADMQFVTLSVRYTVPRAKIQTLRWELIVTPVQQA